jgi:HSP20 family molecular chaperone IbpA
MNASVEKREHKAAPRNGRPVTPAVDIFQRDQGFLIVADLPGVTPESLRVEYEPPELHVRGEAPGLGVVYERRFELGSGIDPGAISAELKNGVLRISLEKSEALRPRRIAVRAG